MTGEASVAAVRNVCMLYQRNPCIQFPHHVRPHAQSHAAAIRAAVCSGPSLAALLAGGGALLESRFLKKIQEAMGAPRARPKAPSDVLPCASRRRWISPVSRADRKPRPGRRLSSTAPHLHHRRAH